MLTTFEGTNLLEAYREALKLIGFNAIKNTLIAQLASSQDFTNEQKLAIKLAASSLQEYPSSDGMSIDGPLMGIAFMEWETVGADGTDALLPAQREGILNALAAICQAVIGAEATRLTSLVSMDCTLSPDWNVE